MGSLNHEDIIYVYEENIVTNIPCTDPLQTSKIVWRRKREREAKQGKPLCVDLEE